MIKRKHLVYLLLAGVISLFLGAPLISKYYHKNMRSKQKMYCYQQYWGPVNPVLFVEKKKYIDSLITYYKQLENGDKDVVFNFPPSTIPTDTCVYLLGYERDSTIAKIICYDNWQDGFYVKGYVYSATLHFKPPPTYKKN